MTTLRRALVIGFSVPLIALGGSVAQARTPSPTPTPTPTTMAPTPTPSAQQVATFQGSAWADAHASSGPIVAKIGETVCSEPSIAGTPPDSTGIIYSVRVVSGDIKDGCGREGDVVTFLVEGLQASQTAVWHAGTTQFLVLMAGPPFARFVGSTGVGGISGDEVVLPYVGDHVCGNFKLSSIPGGLAYEINVYSSQQQPGCGVEGAQVTFNLLDAQGNVIAAAKEKGVWHAWDGMSDPQKLNLTFGPVGGIKLGNTGTGDASGEEGSAWGRLSTLLGFVGLTGAALGFALRRRTTTR